MAGYIGSKAAVTQVDGYTKSEADDRYVEGDDTLVVDQANDRVVISGSDYQLRLNQGSNQPYYIRHASDNSLRMHLNGTGDRVTLDSTGKLGIGTSSPDLSLDVSHGTSSEYVATFQNTADNLELKIGTTTGGLLNIQGANASNNNAYAFSLNADGGDLLVSTSSTFDAGDSSNGSDDRFGFISGRLNVEKNNAAAVSFKRSGGNGTLVNLARGGVGSIGNISVSTTSASFNTNSDYRLKENVADLTGATDRLRQLQPKRFSFIVDPETRVDGFLAHEVSSVVPEAITGEHNEVDADGNPVYQGIDQAKLVPLLTAALQEAITEIETLKTKVAALEAGE